MPNAADEKPASARPPGSDIEPRALMASVRSIAEELNPHLAGRVEVTLDSTLDRDLGLDSLARMELLARLERLHGAALPLAAMAAAETPRDVLRALQTVSGASVPEAVVDALDLGSGEAVAAPDSVTTLIEVLDWHARVHPERTHVHCIDGDGAPRDVSYGALARGARTVAAGLLARGLAPDESVAIMLPTGVEYFHTFLGVLLAGGVPVPIYPPARLSQIEDHFLRHARILANARVALLVTFDEAKQVSRLLTAQVDGLRGVVTVAELGGSGEYAESPVVSTHATAFLQYTSGSTGNPKGVVLSHANLLASLRSMSTALAVVPGDVFVSWLPLYHDMGLIGAWMGSLYYAFPLVLMSPLDFLSRPERWLRAIAAHGGTLSGGPNFAYELCLRRIRDEDLDGLDLSSWRLAFNGAEPVSADTLAAFARRFAPYGLAPAALAPVYGLAEATLGVAFTPVGRGPRVDRVNRDAMSGQARALPAAEGAADALEFVSSGTPIPGFEVRIVSDTGQEASEREEGRLQFKGPGTTSGYHRNPEATRALFDGEWLVSGDRAYVANGEVFVTGRTKDVVIRAGRNIYPYELEEAVAGVEGVRRGCVAVFGSTDPRSGTERLVVVAETRTSVAADRARIRDAVADLTQAILGMPADEIVLAPPRTVLKTSSGKIRRTAVREHFEQGRLSVTDRPVWQQVLRLAWAGQAARARRMRRTLAESAYAAYVLGLTGIAVALVWPAVVLTPGRARRWRLVRRAGRALLALAGLRLTVSGAQRLPRDESIVIAANHSSYLDGLVLVAALRSPVAFVVKGELRRYAVARIFLERIGCLFVERFDRARGVADVATLVEAMAGGEALGFFPEGTFHRMPGLLPFHMGAFTVAVEAGARVLPITIRGTRSILRGDTFFPRHGAIEVRVGEPIEAPPGGAASDWERAVRVRDVTRATLLAACGEPDLADRPVLLDHRSARKPV